MFRDAVQTTYYDTFGALYPGQIVDFGTANDYSTIGGPAADGPLYAGRAYIKGALLTDPINQPSANVLAPVNDASIAADVMGIVIRTEAMHNDADGLPYYAEGQMATVTVPGKVGDGHAVGAVAHGAITAGMPVYVSIDPALSGVPLGEFAGAAGVGLVGPVSGWRWRHAAADGTVGIIELNPA